MENVLDVAHEEEVQIMERSDGDLEEGEILQTPKMKRKLVMENIKDKRKEFVKRARESAKNILMNEEKKSESDLEIDFEELDAKIQKETENFRRSPTSQSLELSLFGENSTGRIIKNETCPVTLYTPPAVNPWTNIENKSSGTKISLRFDQIAKGVFFRITNVTRIESEKFNTSSYAATLCDRFDVFLPRRFTPDIDFLGVENFLKEKPHLCYVGVNPSNKANIVLIYPLNRLCDENVWQKLKELFAFHKIEHQ